ncbi:MAG: hypothetical protein ABII97_02000 [Patescibacteria group bacterium]
MAEKRFVVERRAHHVYGEAETEEEKKKEKDEPEYTEKEKKAIERCPIGPCD